MMNVQQSEMAMLLGAVAKTMVETGDELSDVLDSSAVKFELIKQGLPHDRTSMLLDMTHTAFDDLISLEQRELSSDNEDDEPDDDDDGDDDDDPINELGLNEYNQLPSEVAEETRRQTIEDETDGNVDD